MKKRLTVIDTYPHNYGLLIPSKTGVFWEQQTDGIACHQVRIEGVFVSLDKPKIEIDIKGKAIGINLTLSKESLRGCWDAKVYSKNKIKTVCLLKVLQNVNYQYKNLESNFVFNVILKSLPFDCEQIIKPQIVNAAVYGKNCFKRKLHGIMKDPNWVKIRTKIYSQEGLCWIKIGNPNGNASTYDDWIVNLKGKIVALIYPNCD